MTEEIKELATLHGETCTQCKGARAIRGTMNHRHTAYDGQGRADRTYVCDKCGFTATQNEVDPRIAERASRAAEAAASL